MGASTPRRCKSGSKGSRTRPSSWTSSPRDRRKRHLRRSSSPRSRWSCGASPRQRDFWATMTNGSLFDLAIDDGGDPGLNLVAARLRKLAGPDPVRLFGEAIRQSIDEVLDGPRTGRWDFLHLEKTEKTYVGTKIEIVVRTALGLEPGPNLDLEIEGIDVDIKWAMNSQWQIPREAVGQLCLCIGGR